MARRQFLPVVIGARTQRIYIDDIKTIYKRVKRIRPHIPRYSNEALLQKGEGSQFSSDYEKLTESQIHNHTIKLQE